MSGLDEISSNYDRLSKQFNLFFYFGDRIYQLSAIKGIDKEGLISLISELKEVIETDVNYGK